MREPSSDELRGERVVEIIAALLAGIVVGVGALFGLWLVGRFALPPQAIWDPVFKAAPTAALVLGAVVVVIRLIRAR